MYKVLLLEFRRNLCKVSIMQSVKLIALLIVAHFIFFFFVEATSETGTSYCFELFNESLSRVFFGACTIYM